MIIRRVSVRVVFSPVAMNPGLDLRSQVEMPLSFHRFKATAVRYVSGRLVLHWVLRRITNTEEIMEEL